MTNDDLIKIGDAVRIASSVLGLNKYQSKALFRYMCLSPGVVPSLPENNDAPHSVKFFLPCNIGDTVWLIVPDLAFPQYKIVKAELSRYTVTRKNGKLKPTITCTYTRFDGTQWVTFNASSFGKKVFTNKRDAEAILRRPAE